mgnify:CR=1 FL=1
MGGNGGNMATSGNRPGETTNDKRTGKRPSDGGARLVVEVPRQPTRFR